MILMNMHPERMSIASLGLALFAFVVCVIISVHTIHYILSSYLLHDVFAERGIYQCHIFHSKTVLCGLCLVECSICSRVCVEKHMIS